jgi:hypothetical protein
MTSEARRTSSDLPFDLDQLPGTALGHYAQRFVLLAAN